LGEEKRKPISNSTIYYGVLPYIKRAPAIISLLSNLIHVKPLYSERVGILLIDKGLANSILGIKAMHLTRFGDSEILYEELLSNPKGNLIMLAA
jgi:hypothetical protein